MSARTAISRTVNLAGADLFEANLTNADLSGADLSGVDFDNANLTNDILTGADICLKRYVAREVFAQLPRSALALDKP